MHTLLSFLFLIQSQFIPFQNELNSADYTIYFNQESSTIQLYSNLTKEVVNDAFSIQFFELEIFDASGEYTGSLELKSLKLPASEIEQFERMQVSEAVFVHQSGKKLRFKNLQIIKK